MLNNQDSDEEEYVVIDGAIDDKFDDEKEGTPKKEGPQQPQQQEQDPFESLPIIIRFGAGLQKVGHIAPLDPLYSLPNHGFLSEKRRVLQKKGVPKPPPIVYTGSTRNTMSIHPRPKTMENLQEERGEGPFLETQFSELVDSKTTKNYFDFLGYIGNSFVGAPPPSTNR
mmetsp:Transcript_35996/g.56314  ORF Transcript_35996/g.56314 Transcript_35996/m.56314 type:complete len:169 (-) Transcript_35996:199-705(-)|eukprot:CAMPEP_0201541180 /NCGR_PEP_ID=MMETSP0161_2-20130828/71339_1 /ASSEMBLY_ACC=CAM_ASM_000251 /TAXON_ID=180227 /ORGANISM="Neoparamoeba aestuarina, Strain SoJaBio B1-5/56/2" /LENGTH=168 /DNA_ID=CAMNT_0047948697 /DNA_START=695 /DNA_END=1201 /DNA_ORIENTATION=+